MARLKIRLPEEKNHLASLRYQLRIDDVNYGGHLSNDRVLSLCHDARLEMLKKRDMSEMDCYGRGLVMNESQVVYKAEGFQGEGVQLDIYLGEATRFGFELYYKLTKEDQKATEIARAKTGQVFFDFNQRKLAPLNDSESSEHLAKLLLGETC